MCGESIAETAHCNEEFTAYTNWSRQMRRQFVLSGTRLALGSFAERVVTCDGPA